MRFEEAPMVGRSTVAVTAESQAQLQALAGSHERGEADRARAILLTLAGWSSGRIGEAFGVREDTVRLWRMRFMQGGVAGLRTHSPPGTSPVKAEAALAVAEEVLSVPVANRTSGRKGVFPILPKASAGSSVHQIAGPTAPVRIDAVAPKPDISPET